MDCLAHPGTDHESYDNRTRSQKERALSTCDPAAMTPDEFAVYAEHVSPPCQTYSAAGTKRTPPTDLFAPTLLTRDEVWQAMKFPIDYPPTTPPTT